MSRFGSTQGVHVPIASIRDGVIYLRDGAARAVLGVGSLDFSLQGPGDQEAILASFGAVLNSLTFPVQILVRVLPIDVDAYLDALEARARRDFPERLADLARDHVAFVRRLSRTRTLLERRFYLVVPARTDDDATPTGWSIVGRRRRPVAEESSEVSQLAFRCDEVMRHLGRCGLGVRRLTDGEIAVLLYACWCPELARVQRLRHELSDQVIPVVRSSAPIGRSV